MELFYCEGCGDIIVPDGTSNPSADGRFLCGACADDGGTAQPAQMDQRGHGTDLNLFSDDTIAMKKATLPNPLGEEAEDEEPTIRSLVVSPAAGSQGSTLPASQARKIVFFCLHCKGPFSIRPVDTMSRLACPTCRKDLFVTKDGRILKNSPLDASLCGENPNNEDGDNENATAEEVGLMGFNPASSFVESADSIAEQIAEFQDEPPPIEEPDPEPPPSRKSRSSRRKKPKKKRTPRRRRRSRPTASPANRKVRGSSQGTFLTIMRSVACAAIVSLPLWATVFFSHREAEAQGLLTTESANEPSIFVKVGKAVEASFRTLTR